MTEINTNGIFVPENLKRFFEEYDRVALAFSGGVDSAYLLYAAKVCGCVVKPYYVKTDFQPEFEYQDALRLCRQMDIEMSVISLDILSVPQVADNPEDRCYYCKRALFTRLIDKARADGFDTIIDGTNASDDAGDRPGMRALGELKVLSPLRMCGVTKAQVRQYSRQAGLFTWNKPAYACLATRIPARTPITCDILFKIENSEEALFKLGFTDFRIRVYEGAARLQFPGDQMLRAVQMRSDIREALEKYFSVVMMDLRER